MRRPVTSSTAGICRCVVALVLAALWANAPVHAQEQPAAPASEAEVTAERPSLYPSELERRLD